MPTPLTDADKVLRNDTGKDIVEKLDDIAQALGVGVNADQINYDNTESGLEADDVQEAIDEVNDKFVNIKTITNVSIASLNDGAKAPVKSLTTLIAPIQSGSGTPSPSNVRAISGHNSVNVVVTGKNIFSSSIVQGALYTSGSESSTTTTRVKTNDYIVCKSNTQYAVSFNSGVIPVSAVYYDKNKVYISGDNLSGATFTTPLNCAYVRFGIVKTNTTQSITPSDVTQTQLEEGSMATTYEPYNLTTTTIPLGQTVYGGSLECVEGTLTITRVEFEYDGSSDEYWQKVTGTGKFYIANPDINSYEVDDKISNIYPYSGNATGSVTVTVDKSFYTQKDANVPSYNRVWVYNSDYTSYTVEQFKSALSSQPLQIVTYLITPTVTTISGANIPTLSGTNNLYSSSGDIKELTYFTQSSDKTEELIRATSYTKDETNNLISNSLDISTEITTPASVMTFNDGGDNIPLKSLVTEIVPIQSGSGTPSPSNPRAISGHSSVNVYDTAKNFFDSEGLLNATGWTKNANGSYTGNNRDISLNQGFSADSNCMHNYFDKSNFGVNYIFSIIFNENPRLYVVFKIVDRQGTERTKSSGDITTSGAYSLTSDCTTDERVIGLYFSFGTNKSITISNVQVEQGTTATTYQAFGTTTTIPLGQTVYGGTAEIVGGNGTKTHNFITLNGSEEWTEYASGKYYASVVPANDNKISNTGYLSNLYLFEGNGSSRSTDITVDKRFYMQRQYGRVWLYDSSITSLSDLQTMLSSNNLTIVYPLETPTTFTFTGANIPTLSNTNNIYTDCGDIQSLEYYNNKTDELANLIRLMTRA